MSPTGLLFAFTYSITYTCARTLSDHYGYKALSIGLVLLAYGIGMECHDQTIELLRFIYRILGSVLGSVLGGRWSDRVFNQLRAQNGGVNVAEVCANHWLMAHTLQC